MWVKLHILTILFVLIFHLIMPGTALSAIHRLKPGEKITPVLDQAADGDTIRLAEGEYFENLVIETRVLLTGKGAHIRGGYEGHTILVTAGGVIIRNIQVSESGERLIEDMACIRIEADSVEIDNCLITRPLHGIYVKGGSYANLHNNRIEGRPDLNESDRGNGIHLWNSKHNSLIENKISGTRDGIYFSFADSTDITSNIISQVRYGLHYMYSNVNKFSENIFEENVAGAALMYSKEIYFYRNVFARCRGFRAYGILYQSMDNSVAEGNLVIDNSRGLYFFNSDRNVFFGNDIVDNDLAIQINGSCEENRIFQNNFMGNLSNVLVDNDRSKTEWTNEGQGNYWSDYEGYDLDGDGIGDIPHKVQNVFQVIETKIPE
ncbi:MAG: nitrous oxide reductase family maturation protein NosD, partial [Bacteroidetes bacterium]|nr:nitrous oxide reductase family maturation protein NosD [Bacteroidota bacterium]